eukprot:GEMP01016235.1.p1 GENE.GEMP01016235.1~~GEMP01016235.1.p1  ORF type:complete len:420 (+),score=85.24 GEMP01016235.1:24-1283(+)
MAGVLGPGPVIGVPHFSCQCKPPRMNCLQCCRPALDAVFRTVQEPLMRNRVAALPFSAPALQAHRNASPSTTMLAPPSSRYNNPFQPRMSAACSPPLSSQAQLLSLSRRNNFMAQHPMTHPALVLSSTSNQSHETQPSDIKVVTQSGEFLQCQPTPAANAAPSWHYTPPQKVQQRPATTPNMRVHDPPWSARTPRSTPRVDIASMLSAREVRYTPNGPDLQDAVRTERQIPTTTDLLNTPRAPSLSDHNCMESPRCFRSPLVGERTMSLQLCDLSRVSSIVPPRQPRTAQYASVHEAATSYPSSLLAPSPEPKMPNVQGVRTEGWVQCLVGKQSSHVKVHRVFDVQAVTSDRQWGFVYFRLNGWALQMWLSERAANDRELNRTRPEGWVDLRACRTADRSSAILRMGDWNLGRRRSIYP